MLLNNYPQIRLFKSIRRGFRFEAMMEDTLRPLKIPHIRKRRLKALLGIDGHCAGLPASDITASVQSMELFYRVVDDFMRHNIPADVRRYLCTWACDTGLTGDQCPHLRLKALKAKTYNQIRTMSLHALAKIEIQALTDYPFPRMNTLMMHAHGIGWGQTSDETLVAATKKTNGSRAWKNHFDAKAVQVNPPVFEDGDIPGWGCYMWDLPDYGKRRCIKRGGKIRFENHVSTYPASLALRIMEGLSYFTIPDLVFGVGDGKYLRQGWARALQAWSEKREALVESEPEFDVAEAWKDLPSAYYRRHCYQPYRIN